MAREAIFIGYRREDTADVAGRIYDALSARFGRKRIFKDVDNLRPGADFGDYIRTLLPRCRVVLVLIGPTWLETKDETGRRRLDDPNDWVRIEIETALNAGGLDVVPVLVNGARMPRGDELPESLHPLLRRHAATIRRDPDFHDDVARLATALRASVQSGILDLASLGGDKKAAAARPAEPGANRHGLMFAGGIAAALALVALGYGAWRFLGPAAPPPVITEQAGEGAGAPVRADTERQAEAPQTQAPAPQQQAQTPQAQAPAPQQQAPQAQTPAPQPQQQAPAPARAELPDMVRIPAGSFVMGSPPSEPGRDIDEGPQRNVRIAAFSLSRTEVTFAQWDACADDGGCNSYRPADQGWGRGSRPVINVSWNDAQAYVQWLSRRTGQTYRLPTEAEWEYAARAGTETAYSTGPSISASQANFSGGPGRTQPVGSYPANRFGLSDMHGNVWEWVQDCYVNTYANAPLDAAAVTTGSCSSRVIRGGSWYDGPLYLRSAYRDGSSPTVRLISLGFRVARTL